MANIGGHPEANYTEDEIGKVTEHGSCNEEVHNEQASTIRQPSEETGVRSEVIPDRRSEYWGEEKLWFHTYVW